MERAAIEAPGQAMPVLDDNPAGGPWRVAWEMPQNSRIKLHPPLLVSSNETFDVEAENGPATWIHFSRIDRGDRRAGGVGGHAPADHDAR
jgi:hypothetical protein